MLIIIAKIIVGATIAIWVTEIIVQLVTRSNKREELYKEDLAGWRSYVTFKPLPRFYDKHPNPAPQGSAYKSSLLHAISRRMQEHGYSVESVREVASAERLTLCGAGCHWNLTLGCIQRHPEQWLLTVDQRFRHGTSAPHDTVEGREFLQTLRQTLEAMEISTVRWHARQDWDRGDVDTWAYRPF